MSLPLPVLTAFSHDLRYFASLIRSVTFATAGGNAAISLRKNGITIRVEEARSLLAIAYIMENVFDEYAFSYDKDEAEFQIPLHILLDCLNIFGTAGGSVISQKPKQQRWHQPGDVSDHDAGTSRIDQYFPPSSKGTGMRMSWQGPGNPLTLFIAEDASGPSTTCEITTYDYEDGLELPYDDSQTILKIILKSSWLRDALSELDQSYDKLTFIAAPNTDPETGKVKRNATAPLFRIRAAGSFGSTEMDYPDDRQVLESYECIEKVKVSYRLSSINKTLRVLQQSTKTSLRIDTDGLLSLQFVIPPPVKGKKGGDEGGDGGWVEFRCMALDDDV